MQCPFCKENNDKVIDSRLTDAGTVIRRRRECMACGRRYSTKERIESSGRLAVIKKDGTRAAFDREKVRAGVITACYKRPVTEQQLQDMIDNIEEEIHGTFEREVPSQWIGECVTRHLRALDKVAYVRFASVYREFDDPDQFVEEVRDVKHRSAQDDPGENTLFD